MKTGKIFKKCGRLLKRKKKSILLLHDVIVYMEEIGHNQMH